MPSRRKNAPNDPVDDAAQLGLAVVGDATALHTGDEELHTGDEDAVIAAGDNLRDIVDELVDEPLTDRQEDVVEALASASSGLTVGLAAEVAFDQHRPVGDVLQGAARSVLMQQHVGRQQQADSRNDADE